MSKKFIDLDKLSRLSKSLDDRSKAAVKAEEQRALAAEQALQTAINGKAASGHKHDDRYYTESEINTKVTNLQAEIDADVKVEADRAKAVEADLQAAIDGKSASGHTHDERYYTETEINTKLAGKSDVGHDHDDDYYTETEIDSKITTINTAIATAKSDAQKYADNKIIALVDSAPDAMNTLNELAKAINDHQDEYEAYVQTVSSNITTAKSEAIASAESKDAALKTTLQAEIDADVKVEADRAKAAEQTLQANIDKKANSSHGNHVPTTQTANNAKFLRNDNTWQTVTPGNIGAYTKTEIDSKVTTINNAISGKADSSHGNHVPATQTANNAVFLRNDNTWQTITPGNIGAAKASHGTHVDYATAVPKAPGTAAIGTVNRVAREDHVHPLQTSVSGNAGTATKLATPVTLTIGDKGKTFDGSGNVSWSLSEMGAYSNKGGTIGGTINYQFSGTGGHAIGLDWTNNDTKKTKFGGIGGLANAGVGSILYMGWGSEPWSSANNFCVSSSAIKYKNNKIYHAGDKPTLSELGAAAESHGTHVTYASSAPKANGTAAVGSSGKVAREDHVHPLQTTVSGNAGTATKLQTARYINGTLFDGSGNITTANWGSSRNISISDSDGTNTGKAVSVNGSANTTLKLPATIKASLSGNASTATKLAAARTINGTNFDGSANITTANWGTSRKINQISVNGSADVKIPLDYYTCNIGASNSKPYHHILTTGQCTDSYIDKAITIVITQHYNGGGLGIARAVLRTNDTANGATATGELKWLVRLGFNENQLCYNLRNTVKDAYMDIFFKCNGTYGSATWYVLTEGARGSHNSQWTKQNTHHDNGTHVYNETGMKAIRTYTSTLVAAEDAGFAERSNNAYYADNAGTATKLAVAKTLTIGNAGKSFDGSNNVKWTLAEIGAEPIAKTVVSKTKSGTTLTLSKDRYQKASLASGDTIALPSVSAYTEIELFVKDCSLTNINLPDNCKWRVDHNLSAGTSFIIRFVYTTQEWLGEIKIFS